MHIERGSIVHTTAKRSAFIASAIRSCRKRLRLTKVTDTTGATLTGGEVLVRALVLRRLLRRKVLAPTEMHVGILLPPTAAAVVTNVALTLDCRVVVNLNYTLTSELLNKCIAQAGITHVLTSRRFMERVQLKLDSELIFLEDFRTAASPIDKAIGAFQAYALPAGLLTRILGHTDAGTGDPMTVMFTSGSTGDPKGAVLTYGNIGSNIEAIDQVIHVRRPDVILGILPFFHTFGFTVTLWAEIVLDLEAAYHVNPLEAQAIGKLVRERKGTILLATPMFLRNFTRRCDREEFKTLEVVVTGGEHLPKHVADEFAAKFGIRPVEGYGCTETSPLIASNIPPTRATQEQSSSSQEGTVGKAAPGIRVKVVDQETGEELPVGSRGILMVSGPNVMTGYLNQPEATLKSIRDGWYMTGDLATIDDEGFIRIVGRESRFAKIGGEMVSHLAVEEALVDIVGTDDEGGPKLIVVSVPDPARGERLVVIHTGLDQTPDQLRRKLAEDGLPNLYLPGTDSYVEIDVLPTIGTGKIDLRRVREIASAAFAKAPVTSG